MATELRLAQTSHPEYQRRLIDQLQHLQSQPYRFRNYLGSGALFQNYLA
jgi:hypothetical protein